MYCYNRAHHEVLAYVQNSNADLFLLQEVPHTLLPSLSALYPHHAYAVDSERVYGGAEWTNYNVILSKYPLTDIRTVPFEPIPLPFRTKLAILCMTPLGWARTWNRNAIVARAETPLGSIDVASVHLTLSRPKIRAQEFASVMASLAPSVPAIVGGDFNIIERPLVKPLSYALGADVSESLPWFDERTLFEERFAALGFQNPLRHQVTHGFSRSQLDHILVSKHVRVEKAEVSGELHGSDHAPVMVTITESQTKLL
jgi:endonuclease/exonuclease/phosphatase family metal-dependent hydrolase